MYYFFTLFTTTCYAKVQILYTVVCKKDIEFVVNTCTCTDVFTILTSKNQSGGIYIYGFSKQTSSLGYAYRLSLFTVIYPWYCAIPIT